MTGWPHRSQLYVPLVKIKKLSEQGLGGWAIWRELKTEGYAVSDRTVYRRLKALKKVCPPHFWDIDTFPSGHQYHARCKKCGADRDYLAWPPSQEEKLLAISEEQAPLPKPPVL